MGALARRRPLPFAVSVAGALVFAAMSIASTVVLGWIVDDIVLPTFDTNSSANGTGVANRTIWLAALAFIGISALRAIAVVARRYYSGMTMAAVQQSLRDELGDKYTELPVSWHRRQSVGKLLAHVDSDAYVTSDALAPMPFAIGATSMMLFGAISALLVDPVLALIGLLLFPLMMMLNRIYGHRVEPPAAAVQAAQGDVATVAHESIDGSLIIKTIGRGAAEVERFRAAVLELRDHRVEFATVRAVFNTVLDSLPQIGMVLVLVVGIGRVDSGAITPGDLVQLVALFAILGFPVRVMGFFLESVPPSIVAQRRIDAVLDVPVAAQPNARLDALAGPLNLVVRDLAFDYDDVPVLRNIDFAVGESEVVAIVGSTGSGKSTLAAALVGLAPPSSGSIELGGVDLAALDPDARVGAIGYAAQEPFLFADSVRNNIDLTGTASIDDIRWAARVAQIDDFIIGLPKQYETVLGERGVTVSGGQRQRIALARALLGRPGLVVFDDATSAIDSRVEEQILAGLDTELNATTVLVAQRPSTIALADRVLFLRDGTVRAIGTHAELMADPDYAQLVTAYEQVTS